MTLRQIGPVAIAADEHGNPSWSWDVDPAAGARGATIAGLLTWSQAAQLGELIEEGMIHPANVGGATGVVAYVHFTGPKLGPKRGWYLLSGLTESPTKPSTMSDYTDPVSIKGLYLGDGRTPVLVRSARTRPNAYGLDGRATVANPFYSPAASGFAQSTGGGPSFTREYNAALETETPLGALVAISPGTTLAADSLLPVAFPVVDGALGDTAPMWVTSHGGDPRGFDRRQMRAVWSRSHAFAQTTDAQLTNGLVTLWCGARGMPAAVGVSVFRNGAERQVGNLGLADVDDIVAVRIARVSADEAAMTITVRNAGDVTLSLRRAERLFRVEHGDLRPPAPILARTIRWLGMPPARGITGASATVSARYGAGLSLATGGQLGFTWPSTLPAGAWAYGYSWTPGAASSAQADAGLWGVWSGGAAVGTVRWDAASKTIRWTQGSHTLSTAALTWTAGQFVWWLVGFSATGGMVLATSVNGAAPVVVSNAAFVDPGTAAAVFDSHWIGATTTGFGGLAFGTGPFGGTALTADAGGAVSNGMLFDGPLTAAEISALAASATRLGGLPSPWSRLVAYWPWEARPIPTGSAIATGRRYEATAEGGSTRSPDANGLTKGLGALAPVSAPAVASGFGLTATTRQLLAGALLATTATDDDLADHHLETAAANRVAPSMRS